MTTRTKRAIRCFSATAIILLAAGNVTFAFSPSLSAAQVKSAVDAGDHMVAKTHGYIVKDYLVKQFDGGITLTEAQANAEVDAVMVETPIERIRYNSYLDKYQGAALSLDKAKKQAAQYANQIQFKVFAHSPDASLKSQSFLDHFGTATLSVKGGPTLKATKVNNSGASRDFYDISRKGQPQKASFLWLGYVEYTFDLAPLKGKGIDISKLVGTLSFKNSQGKQFSMPVDMSKYK